MRTYTPLWSKIVDSSLWSEPDVVVKVFLTLLAKKDSHHEVHANAYEIAGWARKTEQEVIDALKVLSSPDTRRIEPQPFEGRRIERVKDGWKILNGKYYRDLIRKEYQRQKQAEYRARAAEAQHPVKSSGSLDEQGRVQDYADGKISKDEI